MIRSEPALPLCHRPVLSTLRGALLVLGMAVGGLSATAPSPAPATEVVVVGTVHKSTEAYGVADLVAILRRVRPQVILCEYDRSFFTADFRFVRDFGGLEQGAVIAYQATARVDLRPYDIEGRNDFYRDQDVFRQEQELMDKVEAVAKVGGFAGDARAVLTSIEAAFARRNVFLKATPRRINSFECDRVLAEKTFTMDAGYGELIRLTPALAGWQSFWQLYCAFEHRRNQAMAARIQTQATAFAGGRVLVLCGFEHRHFLRQELAAVQGAALVLREYWDYPEAPLPAAMP